MGSVEEEGELPARARARGALRSLRVHVPTAGAWRLQVGQGTDPGVRHLRRVHPSAQLRGLKDVETPGECEVGDALASNQLRRLLAETRQSSTSEAAAAGRLTRL